MCVKMDFWMTHYRYTKSLQRCVLDATLKDTGRYLALPIRKSHHFPLGLCPTLNWGLNYDPLLYFAYTLFQSWLRPWLLCDRGKFSFEHSELTHRIRNMLLRVLHVSNIFKKGRQTRGWRYQSALWNLAPLNINSTLKHHNMDKL